MRSSILLIRLALALAVAALFTPLATLAQTIPASTGTGAIITATPPEDRAPVITAGHHGEAGRDLLFGRIRNGVYTVDGMVAKLQLNYDLNGVLHLYMFVPGLGTAVMSESPAPETITATASLTGNDLNFDAGHHHFRLTGIALTNGQGTSVAHLYVQLDRTAWNLGRHAMVGYGDAGGAPYAWPGALNAGVAPMVEANRLAPPLPTGLLPSATAVTPAHAAKPAPVSLQPWRCAEANCLSACHASRMLYAGWDSIGGVALRFVDVGNRGCAAENDRIQLAAGENGRRRDIEPEQQRHHTAE